MSAPAAVHQVIQAVFLFVVMLVVCTVASLVSIFAGVITYFVIIFTLMAFGAFAE